MWLKTRYIFILVLAIDATFSEHQYFEQQTFGLRHAIPGEPNVDYPIYENVPRTSFTCVGRHEGYYADMEARCQVFRICTNTDFTKRGFPFLCPNGTVFNQEHFVCDWYQNVNCEESGKFYYKNSENGKQTKEQMMKRAQMMVEFPMKILLRSSSDVSHLSSASSTTTRHTIQTTTPFVKRAPTLSVNHLTSNRRQSIITKPTRITKFTSPTRITNNREHIRRSNELFISNLGELSSVPAVSTPNYRPSVTTKNNKPSKFLESPFYRLSSLASNINGLVDDVEADGGLIPNVISVRSPKVAKGRGFSRQTNHGQRQRKPGSHRQSQHRKNNHAQRKTGVQHKQVQVPVSNGRHLPKSHISRSQVSDRNSRYLAHPQTSSGTSRHSQSTKQVSQHRSQNTKQVVQYKPQREPQLTLQKPQPPTTTTYKHVSTVQEHLPLFPPLAQLKASPQNQAKKQNFLTYQQFAFSNIPVSQMIFVLADYDENKPNYSLFYGASSYDVPLSSIGILRPVKQQKLQTNRVQG